MKEYELYTGAYTGSKEEAGVRSWRFDGRALREAGRFCGLENPSYVLPWEDRLYVVEELPGRAGAACLSREEGGGLNGTLTIRPAPGLTRYLSYELKLEEARAGKPLVEGTRR